jgi:hypothetical protein
MKKLVHIKPKAQPKTNVTEKASGIDGWTTPNARSISTTPGLLLVNQSIMTKIATIRTPMPILFSMYLLQVAQACGPPGNTHNVLLSLEYGKRARKNALRSVSRQKMF